MSRIGRFLNRLNEYVIPYSELYNIPCWQLRLFYALDFIRYRCSIRDYFTLNYPFLSNRAKKSYVTATECMRFYKNNNNPKQAAILDNKEEMFVLFSNYIDRDWCGRVHNNAKEDYDEFTKKHEKCIIKPLNGSGGHGIEIISTNIPGGIYLL